MRMWHRLGAGAGSAEYCQVLTKDSQTRTTAVAKHRGGALMGAMRRARVDQVSRYGMVW